MFAPVLQDLQGQYKSFRVRPGLTTHKLAWNTPWEGSHVPHSSGLTRSRPAQNSLDLYGIGEKWVGDGQSYAPPIRPRLMALYKCALIDWLDWKEIFWKQTKDGNYPDFDALYRNSTTSSREQYGTRDEEEWERHGWIMLKGRITGLTLDTRRRSWGFGVLTSWYYVGGVRVCFPPKLPHSFIQNCCWITASFTSSTMKDLCQKWKVK